MLFDFSGISIKLYIVFFLDSQPQLKGVNRVQAKPIAKQGGRAVDVSRLDVFQLQTRDDQLLQLLFQRVHASLTPH